MRLASSSKRKVPHFRYQRVGTSNILRLIDRKGKERLPDREKGAIQSQILGGIHDLEMDKQSFFDLWCEAKLPNGQHIRCWPQYRGCEGPRYDWVMISFESEEGKEIAYPGKVLALYEDRDGHLKALVHSVEYKSERGVEGPHGDSRLVQHYRLQFNCHNGRPVMYLIKCDDVMNVIVAYENVWHAKPVAPPVRSRESRRKHTVMTILPWSNWAQLFLDWTEELKERHKTGDNAVWYRLD
jgi:hypothetical protein